MRSLTGLECVEDRFAAQSVRPILGRADERATRADKRSISHGEGGAGAARGKRACMPIGVEDASELTVMNGIRHEKGCPQIASAARDASTEILPESGRRSCGSHSDWWTA
jgi:hypothetical protein